MFDSKHLINDEKSMLNDVLTKYEFLFNGTLGNCKMKPVYIELHPGYKPYCPMP